MPHEIWHASRRVDNHKRQWTTNPGQPKPTTEPIYTPLHSYPVSPIAQLRPQSRRFGSYCSPSTSAAHAKCTATLPGGLHRPSDQGRPVPPTYRHRLMGCGPHCHNIKGPNGSRSENPV
jgi:hypothetical protein